LTKNLIWHLILRKENFMKTKIIWTLLGFFLLIGCTTTSVQDKQISLQEMDTIEILGSVQVSFSLMGTAAGPVVIGPSKENIQKQGYAKLLEEGNRKYSGNIDIRNINISESRRKITLRGYEYEYTASGSVISTYSNTRRFANRLDGIANEILNAFKGNKKDIRLAILNFINVDGKQSVLGRYLVEQTSNYLFQNSEIKIVERDQIDKVIKELDFNMSGYVSDESALTIGHMLGANAVTVGTLTKVGNKISVNLKIVETESASLLSSGSTEIEGTEYVEMYNEILK
jgi:TolB-like protein